MSDVRIIIMWLNVWLNAGCWVILQKWPAQSERLSDRNLYLNIGKNFENNFLCLLPPPESMSLI